MYNEAVRERNIPVGKYIENGNNGRYITEEKFPSVKVPE